MDSIEQWLEHHLSLFPESDTPKPEYGDDVQRIVYQKYSFLYRTVGHQIEILTVYKENLP